jgi:formyl-CoA transferase
MIQGIGGLMSITGEPDDHPGGGPVKVGVAVADVFTGLYAAIAILGALSYRDRTGEGQHIDLGMMEANATFIGDALLEQAANGRIRPRLGNHHLRIAPHNIYAAKDGGWLALSADNAAWRALTEVMARPDLAEEARFATATARKAHEAELDGIIAAWAKDQDAADAAEALQERGVCAAPVLDALAVLNQAQLQARDFFVDVALPEAGTHLQAGVPWRFSRTPAWVERHAPMMGEHSREVLAEFLGITDAEYGDLVAAGITGDMPPD